MHRQQKTFTLSSLILPLLVTALVIFLASSANAQNLEPAPVPETTELPPSLESLAAPSEARLAPESVTTNTTSAPSTRPENTDATLRMDANAEVGVTASNTQAVVNQNIRADLTIKRTEWANVSAERQKMIASKRAELASSTLERKAALDAATQERVRQLADNSVSILSGAIGRMKNISSNLRERAETISSRGVNTVEAISLLDQVDDLLTQAEASLYDIDVNIEYSLTSENPRENWIDARGQFQTTVEIIKAIRPLLQETVTTLKVAIQNTNNTSVEPI